MVQTGLNFIFPPFCAECNRPGSYLCHQHLNDLTWNYEPPIDGWIYSATEYRDSASTITKLVKYGFYYRYAQLMAQLIALRFPNFGRQRQLDYLVPVPLHLRRFRHRGYNQAAIIAEHLSRFWNVPVNDKSLTRKIYTKTQASQGKLGRQDINNAFCLQSPIQAKRICLIDDVATTGATLKACQSVFANSTQVLALTFAREQ